MRCLSCGHKSGWFVFRCPECSEIIITNYFKQYWRLIVLILMILLVLAAFLYFYVTKEDYPTPDQGQLIRTNGKILLAYLA
jgi:hypothetical protein